MPDPILTRINITHKDGNELLITTDLDVIKRLVPNSDFEFKDVFPIEEGTIIEFSDLRMKVVKITSFYNRKTYPNSPDVGINFYGKGEYYPFNFEITYWVEEVER